jgi:hypothetical protein
MKLSIAFFYLSIILIGFSSCYSTQQLIDDDVYMMQDANVQVGETLTDETSYATYKDRTHKNERVNSYYSTRDRFDANPSWNSWNNYFFLNRNYRSSFGYLFDPFYSNLGGNVVLLMFNNNFGYGHGYGFYGGNYYSTFSSMNGYNPYSSNSMNNNWYGNSSGYNSMNGNSNFNSNVIKGPRGTMAGIVNSSSLSNNVMLKSSKSNRTGINNMFIPTNTVLSSVNKNERTKVERTILSPVDPKTNTTVSKTRNQNGSGGFVNQSFNTTGRNQGSIGRSSAGQRNNVGSPSRSSEGNSSRPTPSRSSGNVGPRRN